MYVNPTLIVLRIIGLYVNDALARICFLTPYQSFYPMIITRTPFRISFIGGGSDIEAFFSQQRGAVLSITINKYMYISSHQYFNPRQLRLKYSKTETVESHDQIQHPILRDVLSGLGIMGVEISSTADVPSGTGLGSSSAFTVGLLHNLYARQGMLVSKAQLAEEACEIEIEHLKEPIGKQDQYAVAHGGLNVFVFEPSGITRVEPVYVKKSTLDRLERNLMMFYTGGQRRANEILKEQRSNTAVPEKQRILAQMVAMVDEAKRALYDDDLDEFGNILHKNWLLKQQLASSISNDRINQLYARGLRAGAIGGKLLGAGGSGFLLFYCDESRHESLRREFSDLQELPFSFDYEGSKIIYTEPDADTHRVR